MQSLLQTAAQTPAAAAAAADPAYANRVLFCPGQSPTCQSLANYQSCNLGAVPSQAFVATADFASSEEGQMAIQALVQGGTNPAFISAASQVGIPPYMLITPGTTNLTLVDVSTAQYLGTAYSNAANRVNEALSAAAGGGGGGGGGGGLSTAAIVAISVVSVLVVGGLIAGGVYMYHRKKKDTGWKKYQDAVKEIQRI